MKTLSYYIKNVMDTGGLKRMLIMLLILLVVAMGWYIQDGSTECMWAALVMGVTWSLILVGSWLKWRKDT